MVNKTSKGSLGKGFQLLTLTALTIGLASQTIVNAQTPVPIAPTTPAAPAASAVPTTPAFTVAPALPAAPTTAGGPVSAPAATNLSPSDVGSAASPLINPNANSYNGSSQSTLNLPNTNPNAKKKVTTPSDPWKVVTVSENNPAYTVDVEYPQFLAAKGNDPTKLNEEIKRYVYAQIDAARSVMPAKMKHIEGPKPLSYIKGFCNVSDYRSGLCSLTVDLTSYAFQSAHPVESLSAFNYRLDTNEQFDLKAIFRPDFKYIPLLSKTAIAALSEGLDDDGTEWVRRGCRPEEKNFAKFQITDKALVIIFDPYTVDNGADGYKTVPVVWDRVRANLSTDAPFHKLVSH